MQVVMLVLLAAFAAICLPVLRWLWQLLQTKRWLQNSAIPGPAVPNWILGHVSVLLSDRAPFTFASWANSLGPIYKLQINSSPCVVISDPAAIQQVIRSASSPDYLTKYRPVYRAFELGTKPALPNILSSVDGPYWKAVRSGTAPCFSISNLKQAFPWVQELCGKAVTHITSLQDVASGQAAAEVDVVDLCKRFTSDVMGSLLFNEDLGGMDMGANDYVKIFSSVVEEVHHNMANPFRPLMVWSANAACGRSVLRRHDQIMSEKVEHMQRVPPPDFSVAGHLFKVTDPGSGRPLSSAQLKAELAMFMGAGFETTSHAISWTLLLLATHPDVQQTLAAELAAAGLAPSPGSAAAAAGSPRQLQWQDLSQLPYLIAVCKESLRVLHPPSLGTFRVCHREIEVLGHRLPPGTLVMLSSYVVGCSSRLFGDTAEAFLPKRWLNQQQLQALKPAAGLPSPAAAINDHASAAGLTAQAVPAPAAAQVQQLPAPTDGMPFSIGPRDCIGQALARVELHAFVATLVGHFNIHPGQALAAVVAAAGNKPAAAAGADSRTAAVKLLKDLAIYHVTLQPEPSLAFLKLTPRNY